MYNTRKNCYTLIRLLISVSAIMVPYDFYPQNCLHKIFLQKMAHEDRCAVFIIRLKIWTKFFYLFLLLLLLLHFKDRFRCDNEEKWNFLHVAHLSLDKRFVKYCLGSANNLMVNCFQFGQKVFDISEHVLFIIFFFLT